MYSIIPNNYFFGGETNKLFKFIKKKYILT